MDDLISRQDVLHELDGCDYELKDWQRWKLKTMVRDIPSAQPEQKTGKWIPVVNGRGGHECNQCHEYAPSYKTGEEHLSDFCPNCGAKMEEDKDEID